MKRKAVTPTEFAEAALFSRTLNTLYDILHEADTRGLTATLEGVRQSMAVLILICKRNPGRFVLPIIEILPVNADSEKRHETKNIT